MATRSGFLTIYAADREEIYGEFSDSNWETEQTDGGVNHVFTGTASEGTMETFRRLNTEGIDHVAYEFESDGERFSGTAQLLRPDDTRAPGKARIRIESGVQPAKA